MNIEDVLKVDPYSLSKKKEKPQSYFHSTNKISLYHSIHFKK